MPEVDGNAPAPAAETPSAAPEPTRVDDYTEPPVNGETEAAPQEPVEEFDEIEWEDGKKYKIPKPLKDGVLRQKDYTQKTQSVAEQRKQVEAYAQQIHHRENLATQHVQAIGTLMQADQRLAQFARVDWNKLEQEDPFKAASLTREYTMLRDYRERVAQQVQAREQQRVAEGQRNFAKAYQETNETLAREIPNWNQDLANNLRGFAKELGLNDQQITQWAISVPAVKMLHQAYLGRQLQQTRQQEAQEPKPEIKPLTKVSGAGARSAVNMATADMDTFARELNRKLEARRNR